MKKAELKEALIEYRKEIILKEYEGLVDDILRCGNYNYTDTDFPKAKIIRTKDDYYRMTLRIKKETIIESSSIENIELLRSFVIALAESIIQKCRKNMYLLTAKKQ